MNIANTDAYITEGCLKTVQALLGQEHVAYFPRRRAPDRGDFVLALKTKPPTRLAGEWKRNIATRTQAYHIILEARAVAGGNEQTIVFAKWIPEAVGEEFRKNGVFYADTVGNAYIYRPPQIVVDVRGCRPDVRPGPEPGRIVEVAGLKVCHALLTKPDALKMPLRKIAREAGVALGTAHIVLRELMAAGWIIAGKKGKRRLVDANAIIDAFVRGYAVKLRPACLIGRFRHEKNRTRDILEDFRARLAGTDALWGLTGGVAAREMTQYLEPNTVTVFADEKAEEHLRAGLFADRNGPITLMRLPGPTALGETAERGLPMATPPLVYAELLHEGGPREIETAAMILRGRILPGVGYEPRPA